MADRRRIVDRQVRPGRADPLMLPDEVRALALMLPEASEGAHMGHPDFRVGGKIFADPLARRGESGREALPRYFRP